MTTPTLNSERLSLKPLEKATKRHVDWLNDRDVVQFSEQRHIKHTPTTVQKYIWSFGPESHIWSINVADSGGHVGNLTAMADMPNRVAQVGILIGEREHWRKGYGGEAWITACAWLLSEEGGMRKLEAGCMAVNEPMKRILLRSEFKLEGERRLHHIWGGTAVGTLLFGRFR